MSVLTSVPVVPSVRLKKFEPENKTPGLLYREQRHKQEQEKKQAKILKDLKNLLHVTTPWYFKKNETTKNIVYKDNSGNQYPPTMKTRLYCFVPKATDVGKKLQFKTKFFDEKNQKLDPIKYLGVSFKSENAVHFESIYIDNDHITIQIRLKEVLIKQTNEVRYTFDFKPILINSPNLSATKVDKKHNSTSLPSATNSNEINSKEEENPKEEERDMTEAELNARVKQNWTKRTDKANAY